MKTLYVFFASLFILGCNGTGNDKTEEQAELAPDFKAIPNLLDSILDEDQKYRLEIEPIIEKYGFDSEEYKHIAKKMNRADSSNIIVVEQILATYGWLGADQIGYKANSALFLVIQHSDLNTQEKYLPMMRQAVKNGKANSKSLALLEDRIKIRNGELQIYGSQIGTDQESGEMYVLPLLEPERVNERRAKVGLEPIEEYILHWNLDWNVDEYKEKLPGWIEEREKRKL